MERAYHPYVVDRSIKFEEQGIDVIGSAGDQANGYTFNIVRVAIVEDKAYVDNAEKPAVCRGTSAIENGIAHLFHILIMAFCWILMLVVRFALPGSNV